MKYFIIYAVLAVAVVVKGAELPADSNESASTDVEIAPENQEKKQEKRGIGYTTLGGYTGGLGGDGNLGYTGGYDGYQTTSGIGGGYYNPYSSPPRVAGLGAVSGYTTPGYYNSGYNAGNSGYNGYGGYPGGYSGGYSGGYGNSRLGYPYNRQGYYNSYPSSYYNSNLGGSIVGGGLGYGGVPAGVPGGGYQYGPGISGGFY